MTYGIIGVLGLLVAGVWVYAARVKRSIDREASDAMDAAHMDARFLRFNDADHFDGGDL